MTDIAKLRERLIVKKTEQGSLIKANADAVRSIRESAAGLADADTELAGQHGVDIGFFRGIDFERLGSDTDYHEMVRARAEQERDRLLALVEEMLK